MGLYLKGRNCQEEIILYLLGRYCQRKWFFIWRAGTVRRKWFFICKAGTVRRKWFFIWRAGTVKRKWFFICKAGTVRREWFFIWRAGTVRRNLVALPDILILVRALNNYQKKKPVKWIKRKETKWKPAQWIQLYFTLVIWFILQASIMSSLWRLVGLGLSIQNLVLTSQFSLCRYMPTLCSMASNIFIKQYLIHILRRIQFSNTSDWVDQEEDGLS